MAQRRPLPSVSSWARADARARFHQLLEPFENGGPRLGGGAVHIEQRGQLDPQILRIEIGRRRNLSVSIHIILAHGGSAASPLRPL